MLKKEVPAGTDPQEYGDACPGLQSQSDNLYAAQYDEKVEKADKLSKDRRDHQDDIDRFVKKDRELVEHSMKNMANGSHTFTDKITGR